MRRHIPKWLLASIANPYVITALLVSIALAIRLWLTPLVGDRSPFLTFGLAALVSAAYGGWGPGLLATAAGALLGRYFFVEPRFSLPITDSSQALQLGSFVLLGLGATFLANTLRSAKRKAEVISARNTEILERYRYNLEAANAGTFEWNIATGVVAASDNLESIHGQPPGSFDGTLEGFLQFIHPEDREMVRRNMSGAAEGLGRYHVEFRNVRADGNVGWIEAKGRVVYDEDARRPVRMIGVCIDASERKRNEQARLQLAAIVDSSDDAIISVDPSGVILTWNAAAERLYGYTAEEVTGRSITVTLPPGRESEEAEILDRLRRGEHVQHFETVRLHKDGRPIWVSLSISPIRDDRGAIVAVSGIVRDMTERKALEEQLRQTAKLESLGLLAGGIAHDFNNLLVGILGNASLVQDTLPPSSPVRPMLDDVVRASEKAANLTQQLLAYSGKGKFLIQPLDLSDLARELVNLLQTSIPRTVRLRLDLATGLPPVTADVAQMQQLVMNLVINGAEAIGDRPGLVTVTTRTRQLDEHSLASAYSSDQVRPGRYVSVEVEDDGAGMDQGTIARIFDPFFTTKFTGRGLGLSAALGIVRGHHGLIQVESAPGAGSRFRVLLPAAEEQASSSPEPGPIERHHPNSGAVLVVDDEEVVRRTAALALEHCGYTVIAARDGETAIGLFRKFHGQIALVVLDLSMPLMSGEECLRQIKNVRSDVPVILSSGFSESEAAGRFRRGGAAGFLQKPYTAGRLTEIVRSTLAAAGGKASQISA